MPPAILAKGVYRHFGKNLAVDGVSLEVDPGEIFSLVGPDGGGKTTLLRMICGTLAVERGKIVVNGIDVRRNPSVAQSSIGYMPQRFSLYPDLSVMENLRFYGKIFGVASRAFRTRAGELLESFSLSAYASRPAGRLSGGMKQKLALACALIHSPATILLDEPTAGVDPVSRRAIWRILQDLNGRGTTLLVSTPYMDEAERAHRVAFMNHGRIFMSGTPAALKAASGFDVIEIAGKERAKIRRLLHGDGSVRSLEVFGNKLHAIVASANDAIPHLNQRLTDAGMKGVAIRQVAPSLEDTFVAQMQR